MNRVQCSLIFYDDDMFESFIKPLKAHKQLPELIVHLLTEYYGRTEVREMFEEDDDYSSSVEDVFSKIHESLAVMDYLIQEGKDTIADGTDSLDDIMSSVDDLPSVERYTSHEGGELLRLDKKPLLIQSIDKYGMGEIVDYFNGTVKVDVNAVHSLTESINELKDSVVQLMNNPPQPIQTVVVESIGQAQVNSEEVVKQSSPQVEEVPKRQIEIPVRKHHPLF